MFSLKEGIPSDTANVPPTASKHGGGNTGAERRGLLNALIIVEPTKDLGQVVGRLRSLGVAPIVGLSVDQATRLLLTFRPDLAIVGQGAQSPRLLRRLERRGVPVVLVDGSDGAAREGELRMVVAALLSPVKPDLAPSVVDLTEEDASQADDVLEAGPVRVDRVACVVFVDEERVDIPPMELAILEELAMRPGEPVPAEALRRRLWPEEGPATTEDVHRHVYRLRKLIGDQDRLSPLITNRRGYGYVLELPEPAASPGRSSRQGFGDTREAASGG
jgi:DNA-binding response OmpR family regulator